jgi:hypothetical protein
MANAWVSNFLKYAMTIEIAKLDKDADLSILRVPWLELLSVSTYSKSVKNAQMTMNALRI